MKLKNHPAGDAARPSAAATRPDLDYLKAVNQAGPPQDPQLLFLLMAQYASANRQAEGAEFFSARPPLNKTWSSSPTAATGSVCRCGFPRDRPQRRG